MTIATGTMILLYGRGLSVEAMNEHREPSHPASAAGRESGGESPMCGKCMPKGKRAEETLFDKGDLKPGRGR